jgi:hypothetical protein
VGEPPERRAGLERGGVRGGGHAAPLHAPRPVARVTPLPPLFFAVLTGMVLLYLALVEAVKGRFYRRYAG